MQPYRLTVDKFLDHAAKWFGTREIVEADAGGVFSRTTYAELRERSNRLSGALLALGVARGDRVATLAWNTRHHLEVYYAAMGIGVVCHTLNPRQTADHLAQIINEAEDVVLAVAASLLSLAQQLLPRCPTIRNVVVLDEPSSSATRWNGVPVTPLEELLATTGVPVAWGEFDEETPAGLCYTSGTTGTPKGVLYTHRPADNLAPIVRALVTDSAMTRAGRAERPIVPDHEAPTDSTVRVVRITQCRFMYQGDFSGGGVFGTTAFWKVHLRDARWQIVRRLGFSIT